MEVAEAEMTFGKSLHLCEIFNKLYIDFSGCTTFADQSKVHGSRSVPKLAAFMLPVCTPISCLKDASCSYPMLFSLRPKGALSTINVGCFTSRTLSVKQNTGGNLRFVLSGGAAISKETQDFLSTALVTVLQGYGMTESCG